MRTNEELKQIAIDMRAGQICTSLHLFNNNDDDLLSLVFMPLAFAGQEMLDKINEEEIALVYEYLDNGSPNCINGYPTFFSMQTLTTTEATFVLDMIIKLEEAENSV